MSVVSAVDYPGAEHEPLAYPGLRPRFPFVYYRDMAYQISSHRDMSSDFANLWVDDGSTEVPLDAFLAERQNATMDRRHPVLAVGSNGCPGRLAEKYAGHPDVAVPVLLGTLPNTAVVYSRRLMLYGALPATYLHHPGAVSRLRQ